MARSRIGENQVKDEHFLSPEEHENETPHYFRDLADATTYSGVNAGGKYVRVKADETGLEYATVSGSGGGASTILELTDTPAAYSEGDYLRSTSSGTEWYTFTSSGTTFYSGSGLPDNGTGLVGDIYTNTDTETSYEKTSEPRSDVDDDFTGDNGDPPDSSLWTESDTYSDLSINSNKLRYTVGSEAQDRAVWARATYELSGDFDIQIDFDIVSWSQPSANNHQIYFQLVGGSTWGWVKINLMASGLKEYEYRTDNVLRAYYYTTHTSGKFRFVRSGSTLTCYVWSGAQWEWDGDTNGTSAAFNSDDVSPRIFIYSIAGADVTADLDNFTKNSGLVLWPDSVWEVRNTGLSESSFLTMSDTPTSYSGTDGYFLTSTGSGTEWSEGDFAATSHTHTEYVLPDGTRGFTATISGVTPTEDYHLADKSYVDDRFAEDIFWDRLGTDVRLLTSSNTVSLGTTVTGIAPLNVNEEVYIHELTGGTAYLTLDAAIANEGGESYINFKDEGQTVGLFRAGVDQIQFSAYSEYDMELLLETGAHSGGTTDVTIQTGYASGGNSGDINLSTGTAGGTRGNVVIDTHFIPEMTGASGTVSARNIGSPTKKFQNLYVHDAYIDAGSLYVNEKKVIEDVSDTINITTDADQDLKVKTTGTGDLLLQTENEINANSEGGIEFNVLDNNSTKHLNFTNQSDNGNITFSADGANAQVQFSATDEIDLTADTVDINGNADISGEITFGTLHHHNLTGVSDDDHTQYVLSDGTRNITGPIYMEDSVVVHGDLVVSGTTYITEAEEVQIEDNLLEINYGEVGPGVTVSGGLAGIEVDRGSETNYQFVFDETADNFKVGEAGDLQPVATREALPTANGIAYWDSVNYRFVTVANLIYDGALKLTDNTKINFGDDLDAEIYHDGSNFFINEKTGQLRLQQQGTNGLIVNTSAKIGLGPGVTLNTNYMTTINAGSADLSGLFVDCNTWVHDATRFGVNVTGNSSDTSPISANRSWYGVRSRMVTSIPSNASTSDGTQFSLHGAQFRADPTGSGIADEVFGVHGYVVNAASNPSVIDDAYALFGQLTQAGGSGAITDAQGVRGFVNISATATRAAGGYFEVDVNTGAVAESVYGVQIVLDGDGGTITNARAIYIDVQDTGSVWPTTTYGIYMNNNGNITDNQIAGDTHFTDNVQIAGNLEIDSTTTKGLDIISTDTTVGSSQTLAIIRGRTTDSDVSTNDVAAQIEFRSAGAYTGDAAAGEIRFQTNDGSGTGTLQTALEIDNNQNIYIPTTGELRFGYTNLQFYHNASNCHMRNYTGYIQFRCDSSHIYMAPGGSNTWYFTSGGHLLPNSVGSGNIGEAGKGVGIINIADNKGIYFGNSEDIKLIYDEPNDQLKMTSVTSGGTICTFEGNRTVNFSHDLDVGGALSKGSGTFDIPHPIPEKEAEGYRLRHSFVESPTRGDNIYRFEVNVKNNFAIIDLPDYFKYLNENAEVWCNPDKHFGVAFGCVEENKLMVEANTDGKYKVLVIATRKDKTAVKNFDPKGIEYKRK